MFYKRARANRSTFNASVKLSSGHVRVRINSASSPVGPIITERGSEGAARRCQASAVGRRVCTLREGSRLCQTAAAEDDVMWRPRTSEPSSLRLPQPSGKQPSVRAAKSRFYGAGINDRTAGICELRGGRDGWIWVRNQVKSTAVLLGR